MPLDFWLQPVPSALIASAFAVALGFWFWASRVAKQKIKNILRILGALAALASITLFYSAFIAPLFITVRYITLDIPGCSLDKPLTAVVFADIQLDRWKGAAFAQRAVSIMNTLEKDVILIPGDFVNHHTEYTSELEPLAGLTKPAGGIYAVLGNHDYRLVSGHMVIDESVSDAVRAELAKTPVTLLDNANAIVHSGAQNILIGGVEDIWSGRQDIRKAMTPTNNTTLINSVTPIDCRLLVAHNPDVILETPNDVRTDLVVAGHTHGGQVRLPFIGAFHVPDKLGPKYSKGFFHVHDRDVFITSGLGEVEDIHFRWFNTPEIVVLTIK